jgi:hypothetical protein
MDYEKIEIELDKKEQLLLGEIVELQKRMEEVDPSKLNAQLLKSIQKMSIETITNSLGVSDAFEVQAHHNPTSLKNNNDTFEKFSKKYSNKDEALRDFKPEGIDKSEFVDFRKRTDNLTCDRELYTEKKIDGKTIEGRSMKETTDKLHKETRSQGGVTGAFNGKFMKNGEKDYTKKYTWDHGDPVKEVSKDRIINDFTTLKERRDYVNSEDNILPMNAGLNGSKNGKSIEELKKWGDQRKDLDPNKTEYQQVDPNRLDENIEKLKNNRKQLLKDKIKLYDANKTGKIALKNGLKSGLKAAVGSLLSITIVEVINEFRNEEITDLKIKIVNIKNRVISKSTLIFKKFKDYSLNSFISTILDAILQSILKVAKNLLKFVKQLTISTWKAIKVLCSKDLPWEERVRQALKIMGMGLIGMLGVALDEIIGNAMNSVPFLAPISGLISPILSGLIIGIGSVLLLQGYQKYQSKIAYKILQGEESTKLETLSQIKLTQAGISDVKATKAVGVSLTIFQGSLPIIESCKNHIELSLKQIRKTKNEITEDILTAEKINNENEYLLNLLTNG